MDELSATPPAPRSDAPDNKSNKVIVLDDETSMRNAVARSLGLQLATLGYRLDEGDIVQASCGEEIMPILEKLLRAKEQIGLILTDVNMINKDGTSRPPDEAEKGFGIMSGFDAIETFHHLRTTVASDDKEPIMTVVLSAGAWAKGSRDLVEREVDAGKIHGILPKPFDPEDLEGVARIFTTVKDNIVQRRALRMAIPIVRPFDEDADMALMYFPEDLHGILKRFAGMSYSTFNANAR